MDLVSKSFIKKILQEKGIYPSKKLGQNFLISKTVLAKIIETADIQKKDTILEIGPGIGTLTCELAKRAKKIIAIEKDKKMVEILKEILKDFDNIEIIQNDVLKTNLKDYQLQSANYKLISNLPYYITSPVIKKFLEEKNPPKQMILMVQKEVAQRICANPPYMNLLAISVQFYARPKIISYVSKKCFWPEPKIDSAIVKIEDVRHPEGIGYPAQKLFFKIVKAGFAHPRKQLVNNLSNGLKLDKERTAKWLNANNIKPEQRTQTLSIQNWINLAKSRVGLTL